MLGLNCSPTLRRKLDVAFYLVEHCQRDERNFARITPNRFGRCPFHGREGWCELQRSCGEGVLPEICRVYPRKISDGEFALSNSCEGTVEALLKLNRPIVLQNADAKSDPDFLIRLQCISLLQKQELSLTERIEKIGEFLRSKCDVRMHSSTPPAASISLEMLITLAKRFGKESPSIAAPAALAVRRIEAVQLTLRAEFYALRKAALYNKFPDLDILFENLFVNHLFYERFPFSDKRVGFREEYRSLVAAFSLLKFLLVLSSEETSDENWLVDTIAAVFRLLEHSTFDYKAQTTLAKLRSGSLGKLKGLLSA